MTDAEKAKTTERLSDGVTRTAWDMVEWFSSRPGEDQMLQAIAGIGVGMMILNNNKRGLTGEEADALEVNTMRLAAVTAEALGRLMDHVVRGVPVDKSPEATAAVVNRVIARFR